MLFGVKTASLGMSRARHRLSKADLFHSYNITKMLIVKGMSTELITHGLEEFRRKVSFTFL